MLQSVALVDLAHSALQDDTTEHKGAVKSIAQNATAVKSTKMCASGEGKLRTVQSAQDQDNKKLEQPSNVNIAVN